MAEAVKKPRLCTMASKTLSIGTHSGSFHADEAMACFLLLQTKKFASASVVRSRDPEVLSKMDALVDVGGVYDPAREMYDHHQRGFNETFDSNHITRLSSAGLVYKHYGKEVVQQLAVAALQAEDVALIFHKVYDDLIEGLDGIDNGQPQYPGDLQPAYRISTDLSSRVGRLNPWWNRPATEESTALFSKAMAMAGEEVTGLVKYLTGAWLPARAVVAKAMGERRAVHESGRICLLETACPWKEHLYTLEEEEGVDQEHNLLYVVYPDCVRGWRVQAVSVAPGSFVCRKALPEAWRGLRDGTLSDHCKIEGSIFVHANGFIAGVESKDGALAMARAALEWP